MYLRIVCTVSFLINVYRRNSSAGKSKGIEIYSIDVMKSQNVC